MAPERKATMPIRYIGLFLVLGVLFGCGSPRPGPSGTGGDTTASTAGSGGAGGSGGVTYADLPPTWSDEAKCVNVDGVGPALPTEANAWSIVCMAAPQGGRVRTVRVYPAVGGQCVALPTDMLLIAAPLGDPPVDPTLIYAVSVPAADIPAGQAYVRQELVLTEPFDAPPGMVCVATRLATEGETSACYVHGLDCGGSWLSLTPAPFEWVAQNHIPIIGLNIVD